MRLELNPRSDQQPPGLLNYQQLSVVSLYYHFRFEGQNTMRCFFFPTIDISFKALFGFSCFFCLHKSQYLFECTQYGLSSSIRIKPGCSSCLRKQTLRDRENRLNKIDSIFCSQPSGTCEYPDTNNKHLNAEDLKGKENYIN